MNKIFLKLTLLMGIISTTGLVSSINNATSKVLSPTGVIQNSNLLGAANHEEYEDVSSFINVVASRITTTNASITLTMTFKFKDSVEPDTKPIYTIGYRASDQYPVKPEAEVIPVVKLVTTTGEFTGPIIKQGANLTGDNFGDKASDFADGVSTFANIPCDGIFKSAKVYGLLPTTYEGALPTPDFTKKGGYATVTTKSTTTNFNLNGVEGDPKQPVLFTSRLETISKFGSLISIDAKFSTHFVEHYLDVLKPKTKQTIKDKLEAGTLKISSKINVGAYGKIIIKTDDPTKNTYQYPVTTYSSYFLDGEMNFNVILNQDELKLNGNIVETYVEDISIVTYIYAPSDTGVKQNPQPGTSVYFDLGFVNLNPTKVSTGILPLDLITIISLVSLIAIIAVAGVPVYFIKKKAGLNKEFGEVNKVEFIKVNIMACLTGASLLMFFLSTIFRFTLFNNTFTVYNSLDIFVVATFITSIILVGYFVRYFMIVYKNYRAQKKADAQKNSKKEYYF